MVVRRKRVRGAAQHDVSHEHACAASHTHICRVLHHASHARRARRRTSACLPCYVDTMDLRVATLLVTISEGPRRAQARLDTFSALRRKGASGYQPLAHE